VTERARRQPTNADPMGGGGLLWVDVVDATGDGLLAFSKCV
jgi:hypothetical protein